MMDGQEKIMHSQCLSGLIHLNTKSQRCSFTFYHLSDMDIKSFKLNAIYILILCVLFKKMEANLLLINDVLFWFLPRNIILGQHTVHSHHVKSIGVFPACFQKPLLLQTMHSRTFRGRILIFGTGPTWLPEFPESGRALLPLGSTDDAAGSRSSPGQNDRSCSPG